MSENPYLPLTQGKSDFIHSPATGTAGAMAAKGHRGFESQAHQRLEPGPNALSRFARRVWNGITGVNHAIESRDKSGEKQVVFGQITEINVAKVLAGLSKPGGKMQTEPFTRDGAFARLGYLGGEMNRPREYAAMLYALGELMREGVIEEQPNPNFEGTYWFRVNPQRQIELTNIANRPLDQDKSLSHELAVLPGRQPEQDAYIRDFLGKNGVQLDLAA